MTLRRSGVLFAGYDPEKEKNDVVYLVVNPYWENVSVRLPALPQGYAWGICIDTAEEDLAKQCREEPAYLSRVVVSVQARSVCVFTMVEAI